MPSVLPGPRCAPAMMVGGVAILVGQEIAAATPPAPGWTETWFDEIAVEALP